MLASGLDVVVVLAMEISLESSLYYHSGLYIPIVMLQHQKSQFLSLYI